MLLVPSLLRHGELSGYHFCQLRASILRQGPAAFRLKERRDALFLWPPGCPKAKVKWGVGTICSLDREAKRKTRIFGFNKHLNESPTGWGLANHGARAEVLFRLQLAEA